VTAPAGNDAFTVTMYQGLNATGSVLSSATVTAVVSATQPTTVPVT
jgi:putative Mn2+ efflux pump MntP